jgi:hypothetical protein
LAKIERRPERVAADEEKRIPRLRREIEAHHVEAGAVEPQRGPAGA